MKTHRLRAPAVDGAVLADPPLAQAGGLLTANSQRLADWDHDFQGRRFGRLRSLVRAQAIEKARDYHTRAGLDLPQAHPAEAHLVATGHQPELFHPGVWVKNFAVARLAREHAAVGLNLVVDNDIPKSASVRVPHRAAGELRSRLVEFDEWGGEVPFEDLRARDEALFATFAQRVRAELGNVVPDPLVDDFWPRALRHREHTSRLGVRFALARREVEASWGARNWEVPLSALCESDGFLWFASHLLAQLPRFQQVHNDALTRYRALYGIRSKHHPVPALGRRDDWLEAPFWVWRADAPRRRPLLARQLARTMLLRVDGEDEPFLEVPLAPDRDACCAIDQLLALPARGIRLRTRALTTTMFARLLLSDLFVHGIGGAKYDELGDEIVHEFFGITPPAYLTLSLTLWLDLGTDPATPERLHATERALRDLTYNPDRNLGGQPPAAARRWIEAKHAAITRPAVTHAERLEQFRVIRQCNEALQGGVAETRSQLEAERARIVSGLQRNALARSREYSFILHSRTRVHDAMAAVGPDARQKNEHPGH
ncbi:MAG: hypothetical protein P4L84_05635 [Isosphaeraceae bacterium]|nr:hypothetical protein [Isosphaeraceae bacterium]